MGVAQTQHQLLQLLLHAVHSDGAARHKGRQYGLQVSTRAEPLVVAPNYQALVVLFCQLYGFGQTFAHVGTDGMHLGFDAGNQHLVVQRPQANGLVFVHGGACGGRVGRLAAQHVFWEVLALVHGQIGARLKRACSGVERAFRLVYTAALGHRAFKHPLRQWRSA